MADNAYRTIVRPAARGSKKGWVLVSGEIPPAVAERWRAVMIERGVYQTDLVFEAVNMLLRREQCKRQRERRSDTRSGRRGADLTAAGV